MNLLANFNGFFNAISMEKRIKEIKKSKLPFLKGKIMASILKQKYTSRDKKGNKIIKQSKHWYVDYKPFEEKEKGLKAL